MASNPHRRVMADTNVLIGGVLFPRAFYEFLQHALRGDFRLVLSEQILTEVHRWMERKATPAQRRAMNVFLEECEYEVVPDPSPDELQAYAGGVRDVSDLPILLAAVNARVDCLVTNDRDLTEPGGVAPELRDRLPIMLVGTFLREVMGWTSEELEAVRHRTWDGM